MPDKQKIAFKTSDLTLNAELIMNAKWGERDIEERQDHLAKIAQDVWRLK
jgi:hypothetical protein